MCDMSYSMPSKHHYSHPQMLLLLDARIPRDIKGSRAAIAIPMVMSGSTSVSEKSGVCLGLVLGVGGCRNQVRNLQDRIRSHLDEVQTIKDLLDSFFRILMVILIKSIF